MTLYQIQLDQPDIIWLTIFSKKMNKILLHSQTMKKTLSWIKTFLLVTFYTLILWLTIDGVTTYILGIRGFSQFFIKNENTGWTNKPNFSH